jgi:hypothetical protein
VQQTLQALRNTDNVNLLPSRERLRRAQNYLVDLLHYLEVKEGYSLFAGTRKKCSFEMGTSTPAGSTLVPVLDP